MKGSDRSRDIRAETQLALSKSTMNFLFRCSNVGMDRFLWDSE